MLLDNIVEHKIFLYAMVVMAGIGLVGKFIAQITLKRMIREAENIHKSNHKLMKLVKAKYEHANMVSDRVKNIGVFVDKYLYEYKVLGISFYTWQSWELKCMWATISLGVLGMALQYLQGGMGEMVFQYIAWTGVLTMVLFLLHVMTNAKRKAGAARTYIVDYLENVCAHRYAKMTQHEQTEKAEETEKEPLQAEALQAEVATAVEKEEAQDKIALQKEAEEKRISQEIRIREILEEFLA